MMFDNGKVSTYIGVYYLGNHRIQVVGIGAYTCHCASNWFRGAVKRKHYRSFSCLEPKNSKATLPDREAAEPYGVQGAWRLVA